MRRHKFCSPKKILFGLVIILCLFLTVFLSQNLNSLESAALQPNIPKSPNELKNVVDDKAPSLQRIPTLDAITRSVHHDAYEARIRRMNLRNNPFSSLAPGIFLRHQPSVKVSLNMSQSEAEENFHKYASTLHALCKQSVRLGNISDGGWDLCISGPYKPGTPCLVYSFGIGDNWSFDDAVSTKFGCTVRAFDPSILMSDHRRGDNIWFYNVGLGKANYKTRDGWTMKTLRTLIAHSGDESKIIDFLKIDIESGEWDSLDTIFDENILHRVKQLAIEIHTREMTRDTSTIEDLYRYWSVLDRFERAGFKTWFWHLNLWGYFPSHDGQRYLSCCYELVFINVEYLRRTGDVL